MASAGINRTRNERGADAGSARVAFFVCASHMEPECCATLLFPASPTPVVLRELPTLDRFPLLPILMRRWPTLRSKPSLPKWAVEV